MRTSPIRAVARRSRRLLTITVVGAAIAAISIATAGGSRGPGGHSLSRGDAQLATGALPAYLQHGSVTVAVNLSGQSLSAASAAAPAPLTKDEQRAQLSSIRSQQDGFSSQVRSLGGKDVARLTNALNTVVVKVDRSQQSP